MKRSQINANIRYNESLINDYQRTLRSLNAQINELNALRGKVQAFQNDFGSMERTRKSKVLSITGTSNLRSVSIYVNGMQCVIGGWEYTTAYHGLDEAVRRINSEISSLSGQVNHYNGLISYRNGRNVYWRRQLRYAT